MNCTDRMCKVPPPQMTFPIFSQVLFTSAPQWCITFYITGSESEDSKDVGITGRQEKAIGGRQERERNVLGRGKVEGGEESRGIGQESRGGGKGFDMGMRGTGRSVWRGPLRGRGNWGRGAGGQNAAIGAAQTPKKTIHVKQTLI